MPETPISDRAARTSSSLKGLMIAVTSFMRELSPPFLFGRPLPRPIRVHLSCHGLATELRLSDARPRYPSTNSEQLIGPTRVYNADCITRTLGSARVSATPAAGPWHRPSSPGVPALRSLRRR